MPIEFHCTSCQALLRTPDSAVGRDALCPACGAVSPVPSANSATSAGPVASSPAAVQPGASPEYPVARPVRPPEGHPLPAALFSLAATAETLPYVPPLGDELPRESGMAIAESRAAATSANFTTWSVVAAGSRRFAACWTSSLAIGGAALATWLVGQVLILLVAAPLLALARAAGDPPLDGLADWLRIATAAAAGLTSVALVAGLWAGLRRFALRAVRGEPAHVRGLYERAPVLATIGVLGVLSVPLWIVGAPLWAVGGAPLALAGAFVVDLLWAGLLGQSVSHLVDRQQGVWAAVRWSAGTCRAHWRQLSGLYALLCLIYLVTSAFTAGLALIAVVPWAEIVVSEAYLRLTDPIRRE